MIHFITDDKLKDKPFNKYDCVRFGRYYNFFESYGEFKKYLGVDSWPGFENEKSLDSGAI